MKNMIYMLAGLLLLGGFSAPEVQAQPPTRFEAELVNAPPTTADSLGYDKFVFWGELAESGNSNGKVVYTTVANSKAKFLFNGTGLDLIVRKAGNGGVLSWKLDDGAATGTLDTFASSLEQQVPVQIARGLPQTLHTLEINADLPTSGTLIFLDGFDVYGHQPRFRIDDLSPKLVPQPGKWFANTSLNEPTEAAGGQIIYTIEAGSTVDLTFVGSAIAIHTVPRQDTLAFNWSLDSGAFSGTINPRPIAAQGHAPGGIWYRWPYVLKTGLTDTTHTLRITPTPGPDGANFIFCVDAFDFVSNNYIDTTPRRYEYEQINHSSTNDNDLFAFEHTTGGTWAVFADGAASGGKLVFTSGGAGFKTKLLFYGTGIDVLGVNYGDNARFDWKLDETTTGSALIDGPVGVKRIPIASGLPRTLHTLEIDAFGAPSTNICRLDAVDVYGAGNVTRVDNNNLRYIEYQPFANWTLSDTSAGVDTEAVDATVAYSLVSSDTATIKFNGTAVAIRGRASNDIFNIAWSIDNGAYSGIADFASPNAAGINIWYRWPIVLKTGLPAGDHTLKLTTINAPPTGFLSLLDSIEILGTPLPVLAGANHWTVFE